MYTHKGLRSNASTNLESKHSAFQARLCHLLPGQGPECPDLGTPARQSQPLYLSSTHLTIPEQLHHMSTCTAFQVPMYPMHLIA